MTDINILIDGYDAKLKTLDATQSKNVERLQAAKFATILAAVAGSAFLAIHFSLAALHDSEPHDQVKAQMEAGTFLVPMDYYKNDREKCIRHQLNDNESLDLDSLSQSEVLKLSSRFPDETENCINKDSRSSLSYQDDYLKTLAPSSWALGLGVNFLSADALYLVGMAYFRRRKSKTQSEIKNAKDSKFLLD